MAIGTDGPDGPIADAPADLRSARDEAVNCGDMKRVQDLLDVAIARVSELEAELDRIREEQEDRDLDYKFENF